MSRKFPPELIVRPLEPDEWHLVGETFENVTTGTMPHDGLQSLFYGVFLGDDLVGFAHLEKLFHLNAIYIEPEHRNAGFIGALFDRIDSDIPAGWPVVIYPYKDVKKILTKYGYKGRDKIAVWRKDY